MLFSASLLFLLLLRYYQQQTSEFLMDSCHILFLSTIFQLFHTPRSSIHVLILGLFKATSVHTYIHIYNNRFIFLWTIKVLPYPINVENNTVPFAHMWDASLNCHFTPTGNIAGSIRYQCDPWYPCQGWDWLLGCEHITLSVYTKYQNLSKSNSCGLRIQLAGGLLFQPQFV